jgi:hypothetical protein
MGEKKNADSPTVANWVSESARIGKNVKIWPLHILEMKLKSATML